MTKDSQANNSNPEKKPELRQPIRESAEVLPELGGKRFDQVAARLFPAFSRGRLQQWIASGQLTVDGQTAKAKQKVAAGSLLKIDAEFEIETQWQPDAKPLNIIHEDEHILVLNKAANCVVHPAPGLSSGTLANAVLAHCPVNAELPRGGIIHRLDKDTTGLLVVAKSLTAHADLVEQLQQRSVKRIYRAICEGQFIAGGSIDAPIGRHPTQRTKMAVFQKPQTGAKEAITHYRILQRFTHHTELKIELETGRTHQIRVHMAHKRHPLIGDLTYNPRYKRPAAISDKLDQALRSFRRQALHATELRFVHPTSGELLSFNAEIPDDYANLLSALAENPTNN